MFKCYWDSYKNSKCKFYSWIFSGYRYNKENIINNKVWKSFEEFKTIVNKKQKYERMKGNFRMMKCSDELSRNKKDIRENRRNVQNSNIYVYIYI